MRRADRQINDFNEIINIIKKCETLRLGINSSDYPYVVPLSFGYEVKEDKIDVYFHGSSKGLKAELIEKKPKVCVEFDVFNGFLQLPKTATTLYESAIGFGVVQKVFGDEAKKGLNLLMQHCGLGELDFSIKLPEGLAVYKITLDKITGKKNEKR